MGIEQSRHGTAERSAADGGADNVADGGESVGARLFDALAVPVPWLITAWCVISAFYAATMYLNDLPWYAAAAYQINRGLMMYRDFAFYQMPALPYMASAISALGINALIASRILAWILALVGYVLSVLTARKMGGERAGRFTGIALLLASTPAVLFVVGKTHSIAFAGMAVAGFGLALKRPARWPVAAAGCAVATAGRASYIVTLPVIMVLSFIDRDAQPAEQIGAAMAIIVILAPTCLPFVGCLDEFVQNVYGMHALRTRPSLLGTIVRRLWETGGKLALLQAFPVTILVWWGRHRQLSLTKFETRLLFLVGAAYAAFAWAPAHHAEYSYPLLGLLAIFGAVRTIRWQDVGETSNPASRYRFITGALACLFLLASIFPHPAKYWQSNGFCQLCSVFNCGREISRLVGADATVLSLEPQYTIASGLTFFHGTEMDVHGFFPHKSTAWCRKYHVLNPPMIKRAVMRKEPELILLTPQTFRRGVHGRSVDADVAGSIRSAITETYQRVPHPGPQLEASGVEVYIRDGPQSR